jgi:hypothetical protein
MNIKKLKMKNEAVVCAVSHWSLKMRPEPVTVYRKQVVVPGLCHGERPIREFNEAWGFENGACNEYRDGELVGKEYPDGFEDANAKLWQASRVAIEVSVFKDGSKRFLVVEE